MRRAEGSKVDRQNIRTPSFVPDLHSLLERLPESAYEDSFSTCVTKFGKWISADNTIVQLLDPAADEIGAAKIVSRLVQLLSLLDDPQILMPIVTCLKDISSKQIANDILREHGTLLKLKDLLQRPNLTAELVSEIGYAVAYLQKCTPFQTRDIGFGFDETTGEHKLLLRLKQLSYEKVGVAWRVWDGSVYISRWIFQNKELFANKIVLELGAGCGLCGLVAGLYASKEVVQTLKENVELNSRKLPKSKYYCTQLDFKRTEIIPHPSFLKQKVDIILGSEIMYEVDITEHLVKTVNMYLKPTGRFYGISATYRKGARTFIEGMTKLGWVVENELPGNTSGLFVDGDEMLLYHCYKRK